LISHAVRLTSHLEVHELRQSGRIVLNLTLK
jgi:hypothetical protein